MTYELRNQAILDGLDPVARAKFADLLARLDAMGEDILLTAGYRTVKEQNTLYAQGRTKPGKIVTNARGGDSLHNYACAVDFVPITKGQPDWSANARFQKVIALAKSMGCEAGADWTTFPDIPHLQFTQGLTLGDFKAGRHLQAEPVPQPLTLQQRLAQAINGLRWAQGLRRFALERVIARIKAMLGIN
jgi:peptidoglycan L-alanyl-D-glutamate endopeptidase CwlK